MRGPRSPLSPKRAWVCAAINQLAFPGAGTVMAGRWIGYPQALLMIAGFTLTMIYLLAIINGAIQLLINNSITEEQFRAGYRTYNWAWQIGLLLSGIAWCWSLISSIAILRSVPKEPPVIT